MSADAPDDPYLSQEKELMASEPSKDERKLLNVKEPVKSGDSTTTDTRDPRPLKFNYPPVSGVPDYRERTEYNPGENEIQFEEEDERAERMEMIGVFSLGIAGAVLTLFWIVPVLNILLCLAGLILGVIAISGGETWNGSLGAVANFLLLIWSVIWTFLILSSIFLI